MDIIESKGGLDSKVNAEGLNRGELYLTLDELRWIQLKIGPNYGFILSPVTSKSQKQKKSKSKSEIDADNKGTIRSSISLNKRQRLISPSGKGSSSLGLNYTEEKNGSCVGSEVSFEGKTTRQSINRNNFFDNSNKETANSNNQVDLRNMKLIDFKSYSLNILEKLSKVSNARWFLQPVDPELDGVPDYFTIIENPMDFQTIREKLVQNMYKNPFGWQLDMRLVFYNALKYHKEENAVKQDALSLAIEFENKCRETNEVNPYYYSLLIGKNDSLLSKQEFNNKILEKLNLLDLDILRRIFELLEDDVSYMQDISPDMIMEKLKHKSDIVQEQILLLVDTIIDIEEKYRLKYSIKQESKNSTKLIHEDESIAMTPSSYGSELEGNNFRDNITNVSENIDYTRIKKRIDINEDNVNNSDYNSSEDQEDIYSDNKKEILSASFSNNAFPIPPQESAWGEWKAKVIQNSTVAQRENAPRKSKREREAEQADAEI